jgi:hypothetical protein
MIQSFKAINNLGYYLTENAAGISGVQDSDNNARTRWFKYDRDKL